MTSAILQPIVGHLLSQHKATVLDGVSKVKTLIQASAVADSSGNPDMTSEPFANVFCSDMEALTVFFRAASRGPDVMAEVFSVARMIVTKSTQTNRVALARVLCSKEVFALMRPALFAPTDATVSIAVHALEMLACVAQHCPKIVLARFGGEVPLSTFGCFKHSLPFSHRRLLLPRLAFLTNLTLSRYQSVTRGVVMTYGYLTHILDDAAEVLRQGDGSVPAEVDAVLTVVEQQFIFSSTMTVAQKKDLLLAQRNVPRLLIKALGIPAIAERVQRMLVSLVNEVMEPSCDYTVARTDSEDGHGGMPNFVVFTMLRMLRPKNSAIEAALTCYILSRCSDLLRPYFVRVSNAMLFEEGNGGGARSGKSTQVSEVVVFNVLTRTMTSSLPYHLNPEVGRLQSGEIPAHHFFSMTPRNVAEEVCPMWLREFVHRKINYSTNLLTLLFAVQVTQAAMMRAQHIRRMLRSMYLREEELRAQRAQQRDRADQEAGADIGGIDDIPIDFEHFEAQFTATLATFLPTQEEFWHRVTQQLHQMLITPTSAAPSGSASSVSAASADEGRQTTHDRAQFLLQRIMVLMMSYTSFFNLRVPWISVVPTLKFNVDRRRVQTIASALHEHGDVMASWSPKTVSCLCSLLSINLARGVSLVKIHHVNFGSVPVGKSEPIAEWPLLLSILSWFIQRRPANLKEMAAVEPELAEAFAQVVRLVLRCVDAASVRYSADLEEVWLWLSEIPADIAPCLLHTLNTMLMRGTSKAADRVAESMAEVQTGVLVETARHVIKKIRDKSNPAEAATDKAAASSSSSSKQGNTAAKSAKDGMIPNLWQSDLERHVDQFEAFVDRMVQLWPRRSKRLTTHLQRRVESYCADAAGSKQRLAIVVAAEALGNVSTLLRPMHELFSEFCAAWRAAPICGQAAAQPEAIQHRALLEEATTLHKVFRVLKKIDATNISTSMPLPWTILERMMAVVMRVGDPSVREEDAAVLRQQTAQIMNGDLPLFCHRVLGWLYTNRDQWANPVIDGGRVAELKSLGYWLLTLISLSSLLRYAHLKPEERLVEVPLELSKEDVELWGALASTNYTGSLSVADRVLYAVMLHVHYIRNGSSTAVSSAPHPSESEGPHVNEEDDEAGAQDSDSEHENEADDAAPRKDPEGKARRHGGTQRHHYRHREASGKLLSGCLCPFALQEARFITAGAVTAKSSIPEVDVLAQVVESWTETDAQDLSGPLSVDNAVYVRLSDGSHNTVSSNLISASLWNATFPDILSKRDREVTDMNEATDGEKLDPRYLLPLINTVAAISMRSGAIAAPSAKVKKTKASSVAATDDKTTTEAAAAVATAAPPATTSTVTRSLVPPHILTRCFSRCVRALSMSSGVLRQLAANALAMINPSLSPICRSLLNFCRLKVLQMELAAAKKGRAKVLGAPPTRIPSPITAFVVQAQRPLTHYDHHVHNDIRNFLNDTAVSLSPAMFVVPMQHLLHAFPLGCITHQLMKEKQDELNHRHTGGRFDPDKNSNSVAAEGAKTAASALQSSAPVHLTYILDQLYHSGGTRLDAIALIQSSTLSSIMTLASLVSSAPAIRLRILEVLDRLCSSSAEVGELCAVDGQVLPWLWNFIPYLVEEMASADSLSGELFIAALRLVKKLLCSLPHAFIRRDFFVHTRNFVVGIRRQLHVVGVSSKAVWDAVDAVATVAALALESLQQTQQRKPELVHKAEETA